MKRPQTRLEEVRIARGLTKADLARRAGMPQQTLQNIESGQTKGLSLSARRLLAPALEVRDDELLRPIGHPISPAEGQEPPINSLIYEEIRAVHATLREILLCLRPATKD